MWDTKTATPQKTTDFCRTKRVYKGWLKINRCINACQIVMLESLQFNTKLIFSQSHRTQYDHNHNNHNNKNTDFFLFIALGLCNIQPAGRTTLYDRYQNFGVKCEDIYHDNIGASDRNFDDINSVTHQAFRPLKKLSEV